jgi:hypothetical protein
MRRSNYRGYGARAYEALCSAPGEALYRAYAGPKLIRQWLLADGNGSEEIPRV